MIKDLLRIAAVYATLIGVPPLIWYGVTRLIKLDLRDIENIQYGDLQHTCAKKGDDDDTSSKLSICCDLQKDDGVL